MKHAEPGNTGTHSRILILEPDEKKAGELLAAIDSGTTGLDLTLSSDPDQAFADIAAGEAVYDAAVVANSIPGSAGLGFSRRLKRHLQSVSTLIVFEPGQENEASVALLAGADDILVRDTAGGYLSLLPAMLRKMLEAAPHANEAPERLAVIVQSDPASTEYKAAAQSLRSSEPFWRALVESPFEYFILVDRNVTIQYVNRVAPGLDFLDVIGKVSPLDYIDPEMHEDIRRSLDVVFNEGTPVHFESYTPFLDRWYSNTAGPLYKGEEIIGASIFARDITDRKTYQIQLEESEKRFRRLAEAIHDVFYILDIEKRQALYVSPAYEEMYGRPAKEIYENPMSWIEAVHPDDRERVLASFATLGETVTDGFQGNDYRIVKPDGAVRWLQHRAFVFKTENGRPTQVVGVATDVTASKEASERLRESEEKYRTLVHHASDGIFISDMEGGYIEANDSGCEMLGYSRDELFRLNFRDIVTKEDLEKDPPQIDELKDGKLIVKERQLRRKDGTVFPVEGSFKALPNDRFLIIIRDITERKKEEAILLRSQEELEKRVAERTRELRVTIEAFEKAQRLASIGTLAAGIAHEINNPIGSILMAADAALYSLGDSKKKGEVVEALASIKNDAKRAGQIVKTVLQLSRQEDSQKSPRDVGDVARRARDITRGVAVQNNVHVELVMEPNLPRIMINPTEIEQVFINLITNAIEASDYGQTIWVRLTRDGDAVASRFVDEGRGMPGEEVDRIFDPFYTTRQDEGGTGLGLSLTHSIVRQHGGTIEVDSRPGKGTTITVFLPVAGR